MGKGDRKSKKGKRAIGSYGNTRKRNESTPVVAVKPKKKAVAKKVVTETAEEPKKKTAAKRQPKKQRKQLKTTCRCRSNI